MQFKTKIIYSTLVSAATLISSILIPIIPCRKTPSVFPPIYKWKLCSLNPDRIASLNSITEYFGYTTSIKDAYILTLIISFTAAMVFFHMTAKKKKR